MNNKRKKFRKKPTVEYLLEQGTLRSMLEAKEYTEKRLEFEWDHFFHLEFQRSKIKSELLQALNANVTEDFPFHHWQRATALKHSFTPLSSIGSLSDPGGRFNIGRINESRFSPFPCLYIAANKTTALQETLLGVEERTDNKLSNLDVALSKPNSQTYFALRGKLDSIIDIRTADSLKQFAELMNSISISKEIQDRAKDLGFSPPKMIKTPEDLQQSFLDKKWRFNPMQFDIPSNSQLFGELVRAAKITGILYSSTITGDDCLAIFPEIFAGTDSFIELEDQAPHADILTRIDATNFMKFY